MTIKSLLHRSRNELASSGIESADLDVEVLLKHVLKSDDVFLISHPEALITNAQYQKFRRLIRRRKRGEPVAYLTGHKEFYGLEFKVNKNVLIPRPETEMLLEIALQFLESRIKNQESSPKNDINVLDLGTGSGNIISSLIKTLQSTIIHDSLFMIHFFASDISPQALSVAKQNAKKHEVYDNIRFCRSDLFSNKKLHRKYNLIIANLPYVSNETKSYKLTAQPKGPFGSESLRFEPHEAIFADDNGAETIKKFLLDAKNYVAKNGLILIELDPRNAKNILSFAQKTYPTAKIELFKDLQRLDRVIKLLTI